MKISVNLATRPFVEMRPLFARLRITMAALAVLAAGLGFTLHVLNAKADEAQQKMDALKSRTEHLQSEQLNNEARMRQPQNAAVLARSEFLNDLFARKSFSWTAVMMDLEDVLPAGVQVTSIEPSIGTDGDVHIRLKVSGDRDRAVLLVRNLETSKRFLSPRLSDESMQANELSQQRTAAGIPGGVEFDILAGYNPLPPSRKEDAAKDEKAKDEKAKEDKPKAAAKPAGAAAGAKKAAGTKPGAAKHAGAGKTAKPLPETKMGAAMKPAAAAGGAR